MLVVWIKASCGGGLNTELPRPAACCSVSPCLAVADISTEAPASVACMCHFCLWAARDGGASPVTLDL